MSVGTKLVTADELWAMPHGYGKRYELVRGELITMSPAGEKHAKIAQRFMRHLGNYVAEHNLGESYGSSLGYLLQRNPDTVLEPDGSFVRADRYVSTDHFFPGPPDLALEVVSPSNSQKEIDVKVGQYLAAGTRMVVVIDPRKQTAIVSTPAGTHRLTIDDTLTAGDVVPGWSLPLSELFA